MRLRHFAAVLTLGSIATLAFAQTTPTQSTQGTGNQQGAGTSADNSSNGGASTTTTKHHKHHKKSSGTQASPSNTGGTAPGAPNTSPQ